MSATTPTPEALAPDGEARAPRRPGWHAFMRPLALVPAGFLLLLLLCALFAPAIAPHDPFLPSIKNRLAPPGPVYWLGTDDLGRDMLSRLIFGARTALVASFQSVSIGLVLGVSIGLLAGYVGGWVDRAAMRFADVMQSIPAVLLALALIGVLGKGLGNAMLAVGLIFSVSFMRITRAVVLAEREQLYVDAARVLGLPPLHIMVRQILPNVAGPLVVQASIALGTALLIEAMLSFLGVGADSTQVSWGAMLETARQFQSEQPLLPVMPGLAITLTVLSYNLLGDVLRERLLPGGGPVARVRAGAAAASAAAAAAVPSPVQPEGADGGALLQVRGLTVMAGESELLSGVDLQLRRGEVLGLVGESGCGKSMTASALMGLLPPGARIGAGSVRLGGQELVGLPEDAMRQIRGKRIGMIFQDPNAALSPVHTIGTQLVDAVRAHTKVSRREALARAVELLELVGVPDAARRMNDYPHQFSGGMAQRVVIAGALACKPELLIADEPTTALDVTIQAQVLDLLTELREKLGMSVLLITHDLGVVADLCDRVAVMYAGQIVETGGVEETLTTPRHPYTAALLQAMPRGQSGLRSLATIAGRVPPAWAWPRGCRFHPRCPRALPACADASVPLEHGVRCIRAQGDPAPAPASTSLETAR
ncbi:dipeptide/oligopeptide/nickel ABC transporter permease/ATP-binding protein [Ramlibacter rhizophilus]|uniref:Dipeptide/oligopeptide/nickel ABC transporter permease/ATP-binding protein n=1 Tax=Ramlibacter rhizophilus TaxID=1781167 RepID=A0A4Z0C478_9BURK|nr:dipeptide/oligopeptide/nickel ABC transporter permease/ATP-binding protein [Ramlibacter rhizophilus]TFZ04995.1 dipeptide/oligopeptide/nickel ABC transporter permease/ATP-binding protein [Ramlibacter rhizophilus]